MWGFTCDTIKVFMLNSSASLARGKSEATEPSVNLKPVDRGLYGTYYPFSVNIIRSTGSNMPGIAQLATTADQTRTFGAVR